MPVLLDGKGIIAQQESVLMVQASLLMLVVAIAVFILLFYFAWNYRASNTKATYMPNWEHAKMDELIWWAIPFEIVLVLAALTYGSTHALDPRKPLLSATPPVTIQVIALPWKWLFIYPEYGVAGVNELHIPTNTPINFKITADAPMNSFWIPALGGQIYAMTGMETQLHLMANEEGIYRGLSSNYSGEGFANMNFLVYATTADKFNEWIASARQSSEVLGASSYKILTNHSTSTSFHFGSVEQGLFDSTIKRFDWGNIQAHY